MSYLFNITGQSVVPDPSLMLVYPFNKIWERHKDKGEAMKEFAYIEFMASQQKSNPFAGYPAEARSSIIISNIMGDNTGWTPDELVKDGIKFVEKVQTDGSPTYTYYMAARASAEKMKEFFYNVDLNERTDKGAVIYKPKDITSALIDTEKVIQNLDSLKKKVDEELYESIRTRSNKVISPFADPSSFVKV